MPVTPDSGGIYEFGPFRLDLARRLLLRDGAPLPATPKVYDVLVALIRRRGSLATKEELMAEVWPDAVVDDGSLARTISRLRALLGDSDKSGGYIETLAKRGYRFAGRVRAVGDDLRTQSLAVLPFTFLGPVDPSNEYIGIGIADALITRLSRLRQLEVRPTSSVIRFKGGDAIASGRELRVDTVIDGRMQIHGAKARVTVQLIRVAGEKPLWADTFDEALLDMLDLQDSIAERVATALALQLTRDEATALRRRITSSAEAYQWYLRGREALFRYSPDAIATALQSFAHATDLDPQFAAAHAATAFANIIVAGTFLDPAIATERGKTAAMKALELDESLADAHIARSAFALWLDHDPATAGRELLRALELAPNDSLAHHTYAWHLIACKRFDDATEHMKRAVELDPTSLAAITDRGLPCYFNDDPAAALVHFERAVQLDPSFWYGHRFVGLAHLAMNRPAQAERAFDQAVALSHNIAPETKIDRAIAIAKQGRTGEARAMANELMSSATYVSPYELSTLFAAIDDKQAALDLLDRAVNEPDKWLRWIAVDPKLNPLRGEAKFRAIQRRTGL